jgi:hypothetical protein
VTAEERPHAGLQDVGLVVAVLEEEAAVLGDDEADGELRDRVAVICPG